MYDSNDVVSNAFCPIKNEEEELKYNPVTTTSFQAFVIKLFPNTLLT